jgi:aromatic ring-opening dioxygenase catalytic subunit (LigB family)
MTEIARAQRMPTYFLSHGGGPWPYMTGPMRQMFNLLEASLQDIPNQLPRKPSCVLVVSAYWEEDDVTISSSSAPGMVYDYYGFPPETYQIRYPAPGDPALAERVRALLGAAGWLARLDPERGFDHGTFSMMKPIYPQAEVPVVQMSLKTSLDPTEHFALGRALAPLRDEDVLIIGSGFTTHNLRMRGPQMTAPSQAFDDWLRAALTNPDPEARRRALEQWEQAPYARLNHPREDHLMPLMVVAGAAQGDPALSVYGELFGGYLAASSFRFSADPRPSRFDQLAAPATA